jgi:hypothetical protein
MARTSALQGLIRACVDEERTLHREARRVGAGRAAVLARLARQRGQFIAELESFDGTLPPPSCSWAEILREGMHNVWVAAAGRHDGDAIARCCRSRDRTENRYERALRGTWPDALRGVLMAQRARLECDAAELNPLRF